MLTTSQSLHMTNHPCPHRMFELADTASIPSARWRKKKKKQSGVPPGYQHTCLLCLTITITHFTHHMNIQITNSTVGEGNCHQPPSSLPHSFKSICFAWSMRLIDQHNHLMLNAYSNTWWDLPANQSQCVIQHNYFLESKLLLFTSHANLSWASLA